MSGKDNNNLQAALMLNVRADNIAVLTIDLPEEKVNTLQAALIPELQTFIDQVKQNQQLKGLILVSGKPDNFIVGADIRMIEQCQSSEQAQALSSAGQTVFNHLAALTIPVVAVIQGECLGGGLELALACHYRLASDHPKTSFALPEVKLGLLPGTGGTVRLPELIGIRAALPLLLTGKSITAKQAYRIGLIDEVLSQDSLLEQAIAFTLAKSPRRSKVLSVIDRLCNIKPIYQGILTLAERRAQAQARHNYPAIGEIIRVLQVHSATERLQAESFAFGRLAMDKVSVALRGIFLRTTELKRAINQTETVAMGPISILGGGIMGAGIASLIARKIPVPVRIKEIKSAALAQALAFHHQQCNKAKRAQRIKQNGTALEPASLTGDIEWRGFNNSTLVIEAVAENLAIKQQMLAEIEARCHEDTLFASNTSSIQIADIAEKAIRPEKVVGLHFFNPVEKMPLVEVIPHRQTAPNGIRQMQQLALQLGKIPIEVADKPGFFVNRILTPWLNEALYCLMEGCSIEQIDNALIEAGFPLGPCQLLDEIGLDTASHIAPILSEAYGERFIPPAAINTLIAQGFKGKKNQRGFYNYRTKRGKLKRTEANKTIYSLLQINPNKHLPSEQIAERCTLLMLNEAMRCLQEGVIKSRAEGDLAAIYGLGFPPFTGGPYSMINEIGEDNLLLRLQKAQLQYGARFQPWQQNNAMLNIATPAVEI